MVTKFSDKAKTRKTKKRWVLNIYTQETNVGIRLIMQHWYCHKLDAHADIKFIREMIGDYVSFELMEACVPNVNWVGEK